MKKAIFILLGAALCSCSGTRQPYQLTGTVAHADGDLLLIGTHFNQMDTVRLAEDGSFTYSRTVGEPAFGFAYLPDKAFYQLVFIDGTSSHLEADAENPARYHVSGDLEAAQQFQLDANQRLSALDERQYGSFTEMEGRYRNTRDSLARELETVMPESFRALELASIDEAVSNSLTAYYQRLRTQGIPLDQDAGYNRYMEQLPLATPDEAVIYLYWTEHCAGRGDNPSYRQMVQTADRKIADPDLKEQVVVSLMSDCFSAGSADMEAAYRAAAPLVHAAGPAKWLKETYEANKNLIPGAPAPDCDLEDPQGKTIRLSDLYGKTLYIDIWATWCGPCCEEIPHLEELVKAYRNDPRIEFVSITVDKERNDWLKKLAADKPQWRQLRNVDFCSLYGISGIPCFLMIAPDGKIITAHAPRPSDPQIRTFIDQQLSR